MSEHYAEGKTLWSIAAAGAANAVTWAMSVDAGTWVTGITIICGAVAGGGVIILSRLGPAWIDYQAKRAAALDRTPASQLDAARAEAADARKQAEEYRRLHSDEVFLAAEGVRHLTVVNDMLADQARLIAELRQELQNVRDEAKKKRHDLRDDVDAITKGLAADILGTQKDIARVADAARVPQALEGTAGLPAMPTPGAAPATEASP